MMDYKKLRHLIIVDKKGAVAPVPQTNGNFSKLQQIIAAGSVHSDIESGFLITGVTNPRNFISLLYYFGLLSLRGMDEENTPVLIIPNQNDYTMIISARPMKKPACCVWIRKNTVN